jgi:hypothetical protein
MGEGRGIKRSICRVATAAYLSFVHEKLKKAARPPAEKGVRSDRLRRAGARDVPKF